MIPDKKTAVKAFFDSLGFVLFFPNKALVMKITADRHRLPTIIFDYCLIAFSFILLIPAARFVYERAVFLPDVHRGTAHEIQIMIRRTAHLNRAFYAKGDDALHLEARIKKENAEKKERNDSDEYHLPLLHAHHRYRAALMTWRASVAT